MEIIHYILILAVAIFIFFFNKGYLMKKKSSRGKVIYKEERVAILATSAATSRIVRFYTNGDLLELIVLDKKEFDKMIKGETGVLFYRGDTLKPSTELLFKQV